MKKVSIILAVVLALSACGNKGSQSDLDKMETDRFTVTTEVASVRDITQELLLNGSVKAWEEATIFPRVEGKLLENILKEGDIVKRNQTIALIERDEVGAVYEPVLVPSTINGVVGKTYLDPGANVTRSTPIALIVNQDSVRVLVEIPERYIGKIQIGQKASFAVEAYADKSFNAAIYKISPVVDASNRAVTVELQAQNEGNLLKSGMFAKVKLILENKPQVLSLNATNIVDEDGKRYVFTINDTQDQDATVTKTEVTTGLKGKLYEEIVTGLPQGAKIAKVVFGLKDGSKIKLADK